MKLGVVVGRFQTSILHQGHIDLICKAKAENDHVLVLVGVSAIAGTKRNPLDYATRELMLRYTNFGVSPTPATIEPIKDCEEDKQWSDSLDQLILNHIKYGDDVTLYGGEDSFLNCYQGQFTKQVRVNTVNRARATKIRENIISQMPASNEFFRSGVIYGIGNMRNTVSCTVDVAMLREVNKGMCVLVGRKEGEARWRLPGGFVDATDKDMVQAAKREFLEETGLSIEGELTYIGSNLVDDWRFRNSPDKAVMTTLFACPYSFGQPKANDDLVDVMWAPLDNLKSFNHGHQALVKMIQKAIENHVL